MRTHRVAGQPRRKPDATTEEADTGRSRALKVVAAAAANITLFTALLYYFGLLYTQIFFNYFRVHYTLLGQTADEILARGVDGLLLPVAGAAGAGLVILGVVRYLRTRLSEQSWATVLRVCTPVATVTGLGLIAATVPIALDPGPFREYAGLPGVGLAVGVVLLVLSWRRRGVAEWLVTYVLVVFALFWAATDYSREVAIRRAFEIATQLPTRPAATLYSAQSLNLTAGGVHHVACTQPDAAYRYRYTGLKLLLQSGDQYVLVPANWRRSDGATFVLPRTESLRLEFAPPGTRQPASC